MSILRQEIRYQHEGGKRSNISHYEQLVSHILSTINITYVCAGPFFLEKRPFLCEITEGRKEDKMGMAHLREMH